MKKFNKNKSVFFTKPTMLSSELFKIGDVFIAKFKLNSVSNIIDSLKNIRNTK